MPGLWVLALLAGGATGASGLVGRSVPPYPDGLQDVLGSCLSPSHDPTRACEFSIHVLADPVAAQDPLAAPRFIIAARNAGYDGSHPRWTVTDQAPYPDVGEGWFVHLGNCQVDGRDEPALVAVVREGSRAQWLDEVAWARRLDFAEGRFVQVDTAKVRCANEAIGI